VVTLLRAAIDRKDGQLADLIRLGMWTGARIEELCALRVENVKGDHFDIEDAKTKAGWRKVPVHRKLKATIKRLVKASADGFVLSGLTANKYGDRSNAIGKRFGRLKAAHGFGDHHVFHSIRRTVATLLENAGVPENVAADIIGHDKPTMTYGLYSDGASMATKRAALERIGYPGA
jgi:integrase